MLGMTLRVDSPFKDSSHLRCQRSYDYDLAAFLHSMCSSIHRAWYSTLISFTRISISIIPASPSDEVLEALQTLKVISRSPAPVSESFQALLPTQVTRKAQWLAGLTLNHYPQVFDNRLRDNCISTA